MTIKVPDDTARSKLPKWAQEYIHTLELQRDVVMRDLQEYRDEQTEQPLSQLVSAPSKTGGTDLIRRYIPGHSISAKWQGVDMDITLTQEDGIRVSFGSEKRSLSGGCAIIPQAGNSIFIREIEFTKRQKGR
jgi:hypothetical protein